MLQQNHVPTAAFVPALQPRADIASIVVDAERQDDVEARESLLDRAFGPARYRKTCQRFRAGRMPAQGLSLVARALPLGGAAVVGDDIIGTVRLWHVDAGGVPALMLGPLAVDAQYRCSGVGSRLMREAIVRAGALDHCAMLLVGDAPYYARFGFDRRYTIGLRMLGPIKDERFLGLELKPGALAFAHGVVRATGATDLAFRRSRRGARLRRAA